MMASPQPLSLILYATPDCLRGHSAERWVQEVCRVQGIDMVLRRVDIATMPAAAQSFGRPAPILAKADDSARLVWPFGAEDVAAFVTANIGGRGKRVAIVQSNYIPWKGYFDMIAAVDEFILYDDMQYTRRDWRNRNQIKTPQGRQWLTIPVKVKGKYFQTIRETEIDGVGWARTHWQTLTQNYRRSAHFREIADLLEPLYWHPHAYLSVNNRVFIEAICGYLGVATRITNSWDYRLVGNTSERLAELCAQAGGTDYISGPAARDYLDESCFADRGIKVLWFDYEGYRPYPQLWGDFAHGVSVLDVLFNCGKSATQFMKLSESFSPKGMV